MAFCPSCGASVEGRFCAKCGTAVGAAAAPPPPPNPQPGYQQAGYQPPSAQPYSAPVAASGGLTENMAGALCYFLGFITGILFLVIAPYNQSKFVRFHAFQAIFFHVAMIGIWIVLSIGIGILAVIGLGSIVGILWPLMSLAFLALWVFLMFKAYSNEKFKIPIIGDLAEKQA